MNIDPNKPTDKPTEELTEKELDGITGGKGDKNVIINAACY